MAMFNVFLLNLLPQKKLWLTIFFMENFLHFVKEEYFIANSLSLKRKMLKKENNINFFFLSHLLTI